MSTKGLRLRTRVLLPAIEELYNRVRQYKEKDTYAERCFF